MKEIELGWTVVLCASLAASAAPHRILPVLRWLLPLSGLLLLWLGRGLPPAERLLASSLLMLYALKGASSTTDRDPPKGVARLFAMLAWPGFDHERFAHRTDPPAGTDRRFIHGLFCTYLGLAAVLAVAFFSPLLGPAAVGWLGILGLLLTLHFGISNVLTSLVWLAGFPVRPLFDHPFRSQSLRDFWTSRWNLAFVEMDRRMFLRPLARLFGLRGAVFGVFVISGLLHEMAISYPAGAGWGGPLVYFLLQGLLVLAEKRWNLGGRLWTLFWLAAPLPILFHTPFRHTLIVPFFAWLHALIVSQTVDGWLDKLLWALGILQFCVLMASFQVPFRLRWREELPRLSAFNQKLMWSQGGFIVLTILGFGAATLGLHRQMLNGETGALAIAGFAAVFWTSRLLCDAFYFRSEDWPQGVQFQIGHALLNSLFSFLVLGYGSLVLRHLLVK